MAAVSIASADDNTKAKKPASATIAPADAIPAGVENAVVKVFSTLRYPDPYRPWTKQAPSEVTGSGVVIEGKRILTNAHVVMYASQIQVQANQSGDKVAATVVAIAPGIDLAVLKLDDESFFDTHAPVARTKKLPEVKDAVLAYGYPTGGTSLSITKGIVSRIEFTTYNFPVSGLRIQIDAAINPGNSGGPAIADEKMIGLAFSMLGGAQSIGYIIPNEEIELFLKDIADGHYDGKPAMFDQFQTLQNPALRAFLKLDKSVEGTIVHQVAEGNKPSPLKQWDVITRIGDTPIDDQGMVKLGTNLRVDFRYLLQSVAKNGKVSLTVLRGGKSLPIELAVSPDRAMLIPSLQGAYPSYFIYGPIAFTAATAEFAYFLQNNTNMMVGFSIIGSPLVTRRGDLADADHEELVVIASPFFPHALSRGYSDPSGGVVNTINGVHIRSLRHLVAYLRDLKDEFVTVELEHRGGETLVFPRKDMVAATEAILTDNGVRAQGSRDMLQIWEAKSEK
jgi:S1-C subfamily serine protease